MLSELMFKRRSIRKYKDIEVEQDKIDKILKCTLTAPSSRTRTPWEFVTFTDKEQIKKLSDSKAHGAAFLAGAPLGIAVLADPRNDDVWIEDASIAAIYIQLVAESLDLGSCWIQLRERKLEDGSSSEEYVRKILGIPEELRVLCIIGIGYPDEEKTPYDENSIKIEKIHYNKY